MANRGSATLGYDLEMTQVPTHIDDQTAVAGRITGRPRSLDSLKALVLLGGSVRPNALTKAVGRSVLDLPVDANTSVLGQWLKQLKDLAHDLDLEPLPVRLMIDRGGAAPDDLPDDRQVHLERDPAELRGTAGLLRDLAEQYGPNDWILAATAGQILLEPLGVLTEALAATHADVSLLSHRDEIPSGLMLVRCGCLRSVPSVGFVDMKEQALSTIAATHSVKVVRYERATGLPIAPRPGYIRALRLYHLRRKGVVNPHDPMAEDGRAAFSLVEKPASVEPSAHVHDSIVLRGGRVGKGAILVRSIVCPGAVVAANRTVTDCLVRHG